MAETTRLTCAVLALLVVLAARGAGAQARAGGRVDSVLAAVEATDSALFGRVLAVSAHGETERAEVRVLETLRGPPLPDRIEVSAGREALESAGPLAAGETVLLLVARAGDEFQLPRGLRQAKVTVDGAAQQDEARALLRGYLEAISGAGGPGALDPLLRRSVRLANPRLRAGVLEDLSHRLDADDAPYLLRLAEERAAPQDVRTFAITGLGRLSSPLPAAVSDLLRPAEPVAIRQAVLNAYAASGEREAVESGLGDPSEEVRRTAVDNLAWPEAVGALERHFAREPSPPVRIAIVRQLGLIGTGASRSALRRILASTSDAAIHAAADPWLGAGP